MPSVRDDSTVELLAQTFCGEAKRDKGQAMRIVGYAESSCKSGQAMKDVYENLRVKAAIARIDAVQAQIGHRTVENLDYMYQAGFDVAKNQKNPAGMATNTTGIARLYNMDQPDSASDAPGTLTAEQAERYDLMAAAAIADKVKGPTLSKETA